LAYSITGRGAVEWDLAFICHPRCHPKQKMGYGLRWTYRENVAKTGPILDLRIGNKKMGYSL